MKKKSPDQQNRNPEDFIFDDFDPSLVSQEFESEVVELPGLRKAYRHNPKHLLRKENRKRSLDEIVLEIIPGTAQHMISSGLWDFWSMVPVLHRKYGTIESLYFTTWMVNREILSELFEMHDTGMVRNFTCGVGTYLKRRNTDVYGFLSTGCLKRGQRFVVFRNHTKILLLEFETGMHLTIESSANMAANFNMEQFTMTEDRALFEFHKGWIEELISKREKNLSI